jgi:hypothetical protein
MVSHFGPAADARNHPGRREQTMTKAFAVMFVMMALLANPAAAQRAGRGSNMGFAPHAGFGHPGFMAHPGFAPRAGFFARSGFAPHPGFFPHRDFVNNRVFFRGFFVTPGVVAAPYPYYPYPYYPYYPPYPYYAAPP